ncbi:major facilitator superfamily domain-containing protein [Coemansia spiralis]|nr:major facilitator superfamily domain-containing protein [Coemansia spiralis]
MFVESNSLAASTSSASDTNSSYRSACDLSNVIEEQPPSRLSTVSQKDITKDNDSDQLVFIRVSQTQKVIIFVSLSLILLLSSMDTTIVTTAIPTIAQEFNALSNATWISTTYLLTSTALRPLYGRLSDTFGRLPMLIFATVLFIVGSALCGWAHSMGILIFGRAVQGIGGAGLMLLVFIIVSDVTSEKQRPAYLGALSAVWSIAAVAGPVLGATFSDKASWRWAFLINLPISGAVLISALLFMRLPQSSGSISEKIKKVDFLGALVLIGAVSMLLLAFSWAGKSFPWNSARIIGLLVSGTVALGIFIIIEWMTLAEPIVPIRLFSNRNICLSVFSQFFIGMTLFVPLYFIPLWYTIVKNSSAISSGLHLLPYMLSISLFAIATGFFITKIGHYRIIAIFGSAIAVIGSGLFILFDETISQAKQIGFMIILGIGLALNVQILLLIVQKAALDKDMATATTLFLFMRILGPSISIAVMQSIFQNATLPKLNDLGTIYPEFRAIFIASFNNQSLIYRSKLPDKIRAELVHIYVLGLNKVFISGVPFAAIGFFLTLPLKNTLP